jgi:dolichol-phosphate mannosyltransferase
MTPTGSRITTLSVAAPAYNEAEGIAGFVEAWRSHLAGKGLDAFELVICNDGSSDATGAVLAALAARHSELRVVTHDANRGAGAAQAAGPPHAWVLLWDADGQFPPDNIDALEGALASTGGRAFVGARREKRDSLFARAGWRASTAACNAIYGTRYSDFSSSCQLVEGPLLRGLCLEARGLNYSLDVIARLLEQGVRPIEVPIRHLPRASGRSSRTLVRSSVDRASFVLYLGLRRALLDRRVLC